MVERCAPGADYRLLIIGYKLVAAARREPPQVWGDGTHTIRELVEAVNADPRRGEDHATCLSKIPLDAIALGVLSEQGYTPESVPRNGTNVLLRRNANLSTGGSATDVTDDVHREVAARAIDAARMVGLDICGVDVICRDITRPLEEQGGAIVELNAAPGFRMHLEPSAGKGRPVGDAVISTLFPDGTDGRVPLVAVSGTNGKTTTVRLVAHLLRTHGKRVGMTCTDGVYVDDQRIQTGDCSGPKSARTVLLNPSVEAAVLETARGGILREGLGFDRCDVAIVTNLGAGDHLGMGGIATVEDLAVVKRVVVENVAKNGTAVLNGADPLTVEMAPHCQGKVTLFAWESTCPSLVAHRAQGGRVVYVEGGAIWAALGTVTERVVSLGDLRFALGGRARFEVENAMAAVGAAWGLGLSWQLIRTGLASFACDSSTAPGRFNVMDHRGATLIVDYGHNPDALSALVQTVEQMPAGKRVALISAAGDRRDIDIVRQTEILGDAFDEVILYEDQCNRGRPEGEVMGLLRKGLTGRRRVKHVQEIRGEFVAIEACVNRLNRGDLALVLIDQIEPSLHFLADLMSARQVA